MNTRILIFKNYDYTDGIIIENEDEMELVDEIIATGAIYPLRNENIVLDMEVFGYECSENKILKTVEELFDDIKMDMCLEMDYQELHNRIMSKYATLKGVSYEKVKKETEKLEYLPF